MTLGKALRKLIFVTLILSCTSSCFDHEKEKSACLNEFDLEKEGYFEVDLAMLMPSDLAVENPIFFSLRCNQAMANIIVSEDTIQNISRNQELKKFIHVSGGRLLLANFEVYSTSSEQNASIFVIRVNRNVSVDSLPDWIAINQ